jgi:hypothetical protein
MKSAHSPCRASLDVIHLAREMAPAVPAIPAGPIPAGRTWQVVQALVFPLPPVV